MDTARITLFVLLSCLTGMDKVSAQVLEEHCYLFSFAGLSTERDEKLLLELLRGSDPELVLSVDRSVELMKIKADRPLDIPEVIALAGQLGVALFPRTNTSGRLEDDEVNE